MKIIITALVLFLLLPTAAVTKNETAKKIVELETQLENLSGKEKVATLLKLASQTYTRSPRKCVSYCNQILKLAKQMNDPKTRARALIYLSYALSVLGDRKKPLEYSKEALTIYEDHKDKAGIGKALYTTGYFYIKIAYFNIALDFLVRSIKVYEEIGSTNNLYFSYWFLGILYIKLEEYPKALEYFQKALDIVKEIEGDERIPDSFHNIGLCHQYMNNHNKALDYFQKSLVLFEHYGDKFWTAAALNNIGRVYGNLNNHHKALQYLSQAQGLREEIEDKLGLFHTFYYLGDTYLKKENHPRTLFYYNRAFEIVKKLEDKDNLEKIYKGFVNLYAAMGDYKTAFEYYKKYSETRDFLFIQKKNKQLAELEVKFEAQQRAKEIDILKKDNKIQILTRNVFITGFSLVSILLILLFKKYLYLFAFWKRQKYIGQYRLTETIGAGGMGTVYLAHTIRDKKRLSAVKVLKEELGEDKNSRERFKHEGTIIDKINHPHIVNILDRGEYKGKLYIAMEYLRGKTLAQKIKEDGKIELKESPFIMKQVADALAFIHKKNIVHRDLKPANIMLIEKNGNPNVVKLLDFGVAIMKLQTRLTQTGILVGTINYIAPEQITENRYSPASDVYSMGMIFYEMLIGKPAFPEDTLTTVVEKILAEAPKAANRVRGDIPQELNRLIMRLLAKEPAHRPSARDVLSALKKME